MLIAILESFWRFLLEAAPWLLLGFLFAGLMSTFIPSQVILRYVGRGNVRSILAATLIGIPLPLCSCGVIPTGIALHRQGASRAATIAFLVATPATTITAIIITVAMLGWRFTVLYVAAAVAVAIITGLAALVLLREGPRQAVANTAACGCVEGSDCCESAAPGCTCGSQWACGVHGFWERVRATFRYGFVDMVGDIGHWIVIGLAAAAVLTALIPQHVIGEYLGGGLLSLVIVALVAAPSYVCSTATVPFVAAMVAGGMDPSAGLVFLILGPATNLSTILVVGRSMGKGAVALYLGCVLVLSVGVAYVFDAGGLL